MHALKNDKNVYIVGAGFSKPRGLPLISDFMFVLRDAHDWLVEQGRQAEADAVKSVLQFRRESMPAAYRIRIDLENIEELFSLASASNGDLSDSIRLAIAATLNYCEHTSARPVTSFRIDEQHGGLIEPWRECLMEPHLRDGCIHTSVPSYVFYVSALLGMLDSQPHGENSFISLNYDLCLEDALRSIGRPYAYFLKGTDAEGNKDESAHTAIPLLKLHGSVNWAPQGPASHGIRVFADYSELRVAGLTPELIPPTWRKSFAAELRTVWNQALEEIASATRIVIMGFSIPPTDLHFKYLLAAGLRENISLREIVFVDIAAGHLRDRAAVLFGDLSMRPAIRFTQGGVEGFINVATIGDCVWSIRRPIHRSIQSVHHGLK